MTTEPTSANSESASKKYCIAARAGLEPRRPSTYRKKRATIVNVGDLIVDSIPTCVGPVRAMIDAHDRYFGEGTGEAFFMGAYLENLPMAVSKWGSESANKE
jgi:hypothetical protein